MLDESSLIAAVRARLPTLTRAQAAAVVKALFAAIAARLADGERVTIPGFGSFSAARATARAGRNPDEAAPRRPEGGERRVRFQASRSAAVEKAGERRGPAGAVERGVMESAGEPGGPRFGYGVDGVSGKGEGPSVRGSSAAAKSAAEPQAIVEVFYATDRKVTAGASEPAKVYGSVRGDGSLGYGTCRVSIPHRHRTGHLEGPSIWRLELRPNPEKHVVLLSVAQSSRESFLRDLAARIAAAAKKQLLVFIHGFSVTFADAARRTAQLAYDLDFDGAVAFYSWPSKGAASPLAYTHDENSVEWTKPHFVAFLDELSRDSGAEHIHLIAHSMGNRVLTAALAQIALEMAGRPGAPRFSEVILTAPDIDAEVFHDLAGVMRPAARRMTLYASENDRALDVSHRVHGYGRAGDVKPEIVVAAGLDSVDASAVDTSFLGHSYYGDNRSVISDIYHLIRNSLPPGDRGLRPRRSKAGAFWAFAP
jgi:esterase/lipase superfamily enzyme/nucleoid DNA-binding protein